VRRIAPILIAFAFLISLQAAYATNDFYEEFTGPNDQNYDVGWDDNWMIDAPAGVTKWTGTSYADIQGNQGRHYFVGNPSVARLYLDTDANWVDLTNVGDIEIVQLNFISMTEVGSTTGGYFQFRIGTDANQGMIYSFLHGEGAHAGSTGIWFGSNDPVVSNDPKGHVVRAVLEKTDVNTVNVEVFYDDVSQAERDVPIGSNIFEGPLGDVFQIRIEGYVGDAGAGWDVRWDDLNVLAGAGVDSNFSWARNTTLDPENDINVSNYTLTDTSTVTGAAVIQDYNWMIDANLVATTQNLTVDLNGPTEYHVCHGAHATEGANHYHEIQCYDFRVPQYPQAVSFITIPSQPGSDTDVNIEITYTDNNLMDSFSAGWGDTNYFNDLNNFIVQFNNSGTQQVCVTAADVEDLNKSTCSNVTVYGHLKMQFVDENTGANLRPQVFIGDGNYSGRVSAGGLLSVDMNSAWTDANYTVRAYDTLYGTRYWRFRLAPATEVDINATLLKSVIGQNINFKFYNLDKTATLNTAIVTVTMPDGNVASRRITDSTGETSFFLDGNAGYYVFDINAGDGNYTYKSGTITINIPLDEKDLAAISPYNISVSGVGSRSYSGQTAATIFKVITNTKDYYEAVVDKNASYYSRAYYFKLRGNESSLTIQPYLVDVGDGIASTFYLRNSKTGLAYQDIQIDVQKNIAGVGVVSTESVVSDSAGMASLSFITNDQYYFYFYSSADVLLYSAQLQPISTTYYVYLDIFAIQYIPPFVVTVDVNFFPSSGILYVNPDTNTVDLNQHIDVNNSTISSIRIQVYSDLNTFIDDTNTGLTGDGWLYQFITEIDINKIYPITVKLTITTASGEQFVKTMVYTIRQVPRAWDLWTLLTSTVPAELNSGGNKNTTTLIAMFIALVAMAAAIAGVGIDTGTSAIIGIAVMGFFAWLGWVDIPIFIFMAVAAGLLWIFARREAI